MEGFWHSAGSKALKMPRVSLQLKFAGNVARVYRWSLRHRVGLVPTKTEQNEPSQKDTPRRIIHFWNVFSPLSIDLCLSPPIFRGIPLSASGKKENLRATGAPVACATVLRWAPSRVTRRGALTATAAAAAAAAIFPSFPLPLSLSSSLRLTASTRSLLPVALLVPRGPLHPHHGAMVAWQPVLSATKYTFAVPFTSKCRNGCSPPPFLPFLSPSSSFVPPREARAPNRPSCESCSRLVSRSIRVFALIRARPGLPFFLFSSPPLLLSLPFQKVSNGFRPRYRRFAPLSPNGRTESDPRLEEVTLLDHDRGEERSVCFPRSRVSVPWHTNKCIDRYTLLARPRLKVQQSPASWTGRANRLASRDNAYTLDRKDRFERKRWLVEHQCLPEFFFTFFSSFSAGLLFFLPLVVVRVPPPPLGSRAPRVVNLLSSPFPLPFSLPPSLTLTCEPGTPFGSRGTVHRHGTHANSPIEMASLGCVGLWRVPQISKRSVEGNIFLCLLLRF